MDTFKYIKHLNERVSRDIPQTLCPLHSLVRLYKHCFYMLCLEKRCGACMPTDSGHSFNITNEAEDTLPASQGDTPDLDQGLVTLGILVESADRAITPITPIPDPIAPLPDIEDSPFITDLSDVLAAVGVKGGRTQESPNGQHAPPTVGYKSPPIICINRRHLTVSP